MTLLLPYNVDMSRKMSKAAAYCHLVYRKILLIIIILCTLYFRCNPHTRAEYETKGFGMPSLYTEMYGRMEQGLIRKPTLSVQSGLV